MLLVAVLFRPSWVLGDSSISPSRADWVVFGTFDLRLPRLGFALASGSSVGAGGLPSSLLVTGLSLWASAFDP